MRWLAALLLALWAGLAQAVSFRTERFDVDADIRADRSVAITERIVVVFSEPKRGLIRTLPFRTANEQNVRTVAYEFGDFTANGRPVPYQSSDQGGQYELKIGDPNGRVNGRVEYVLRYTVRGALTNIENGDAIGPRAEWLWNVVPFEWPTSIDASTVTVTYPEPVSDNFGARLIRDKKGFRAGAELFWNKPIVGRKDLLDVRFDGRRKFVASSKTPMALGVGMTLVLALPKGTVDPNDDAVIGDVPSPDSGPAPFTALQNLPSQPWGAVLPLLPAAVAVWLASKRRNPSQGPLVTRFDAPEGVGPSESGLLMDLKFNPRDVVAGLISLAQKGAAKIRSAEEGLTIELQVDKAGAPLSLKRELTQFEQNLLFYLVPAGPVISPDTFRETLDRSLYASLKFAAVSEAEAQGLWSDKRSSAGCVGCLASLAVMAAGILLVPVVGFWSLAGIPIGLILIGVSAGMVSPLTPAGAKVQHHLKGLREFINRANKKELQYMADRMPDQALFEELLPFAIAFGLVHKWVGAFEGIDMVQPDWYVSDAGTQYWMYSAFANDLNRFDGDYGSAAIEASLPAITSSGGTFSSGDSGFGGGWSSGGGSDGGGGFDGGSSGGDGGGGGGGGDW